MYAYHMQETWMAQLPQWHNQHFPYTLITYSFVAIITHTWYVDKFQTVGNYYILDNCLAQYYTILNAGICNQTIIYVLK